MKTLRALWIATAVTMAGCAAPAEPPPAAPPVDIDAEKAAIQEAIAAQLAANNQPGEAGADGYVSVAAEDLALLPPNGPRVDGRQAVREWALQFTTATDFSVTYAATTVEVAASGDLAYALGTYSLSLVDADGNPVTDAGKFMDGFRKDSDGSWKMTVIAYNSDLPVAE